MGRLDLDRDERPKGCLWAFEVDLDGGGRADYGLA
jgi:hypothetical protein